MRWGLVVVALVFVAGCVSVPCTKGPAVSARGLQSLPSETGSGDYRLEVAVTDPAGLPIPGAGVAVYFNTLKPGDDPANENRPEAGRDREIVRPGRTAGTPEPKVVLFASTNELGLVAMHVPSNRIVGITAAAANYTEEWVGHMATAGSGLGGRIVVPLYPEHLAWDVKDVWGPGAASTAMVFGNSYA